MKPGRPRPRGWSTRTVGLVVTEVAMVASGTMAVSRMIPTWLLQAGLAWLFWRGAHAKRVLTS